MRNRNSSVDNITALLPSMEGRYLIMGGCEQLDVFDLITDEKKPKKNVDGTIRCLILMPQANFFFSGGSKGNLIKWSITHEYLVEVLHEFKTSTNQIISIYSLVFFKDGLFLLGCSGGKIFLFNEKEKEKKLLQAIGEDVRVESLITLSNSRIASGLSNSSIIIWKFNDSNFSLTQIHDDITNVHKAPIMFLAELDDERLASASRIGELFLWDPETLKKEKIQTAKNSDIIGLVVLPHTRLLISVSKSNATVWDVVTGIKIKSFSFKKEAIAVCLLPDARLAIGFKYGFFQIMSLDLQSSFSRAKHYHSVLFSVFKDDLQRDILSRVKRITLSFEKSEFLVTRSLKSSENIEEKNQEPQASNPLDRAFQNDLADLLTLDYARTDHGGSVYSPSAYFYDLMRVVLSCIHTKKLFPECTLLARRPDLLDIPLNSENATTFTIPTLCIVNYVLARQLLQKKDYDLFSPKEGYISIMSNYENLAFKEINNLSLSNTLFFAFDLYFDSQKIYLKAIGKSFYDLSCDVLNSKERRDLPTSIPILAKRYLGLNDKIAAKLENLESNFEPDFIEKSSDTKFFCKSMRINYERLGELLHINYSDSKERQYVDLIEKKDRYINAGSSQPIKLKLDTRDRREQLLNLTEERLKRIDVFHYFSQQLELNCDELELIFKLMPSPSLSICDLYLIKKIQDDLKLPTYALFNLLIRSDSNIFRILIETILINSSNERWLRSIKLIPINTGILKEYFEIITRYYSDLISEAEDKELFFRAVQALTHISTIGDFSIQELAELYKYLADDFNAEIFIRFVYAIGQLKKSYDRNLIELSQMAFYIKPDNISEISSQNDIVRCGLKIIFDLFSKNIELEKFELEKFLINLFSLNKVFIRHEWKLDELMFVRFGIMSEKNQNKSEKINEELPMYFNKLMAKTISEQREFYSKSEILFDIDPVVFSRLTTDFDNHQNDCSFRFFRMATLLKLLKLKIVHMGNYDDEFQKILDDLMIKIKDFFKNFTCFDQETISKVNNLLDKIKLSINNRNIFLGKQDIGLSDIVSSYDSIKNRSPQEIESETKKNIDNHFNDILVSFRNLDSFLPDDLDIFIKLSKELSEFYPDDSMKSIITIMLEYKKCESIYGDLTSELLLSLCCHQNSPSDNQLISKVLNIDLSCWSIFCKILFEPGTIFFSNLTNVIKSLNRITILRSSLHFFEYNIPLVIELFRDENLKSSSQYLSQFLEKKNKQAYDKALCHLNERKRDILVEAALKYFKTKSEYDSFNLDNPDRLSEYLLIDVSMSGLDSISPIAQAHSTLQWYLRRCIEGVEQESYHISIDVRVQNTWLSWIENYRVWEANRKVFLYPENFLSPELRKTQSPEFRQLSSTLCKSYLDDEAVSQAYLQYITSTMKLRNIVFCTSCVVKLAHESGSMFYKYHLFGHDNASPKQYYHCTVEYNTNGSDKEKFQNWTFWEKLPLSISHEKIEDRASIKAIFRNNRPYLYWLNKKSDTPISIGSLAEETDLTRIKISKNTEKKYQLFCSYQHLDGSWEAAQLLDDINFNLYLDFLKNNFIGFEIDINGKFTQYPLVPSRDCENVAELEILGNTSTLSISSPLNNFLSSLYEILTTNTIEAISFVDQTKALEEMSDDYLWVQYYWELMYFAPLTLANALQKTQRYDKALSWYKTIFNPSRRYSASESVASPFIFGPFVQSTGNNILSPLSNRRDLEALHYHAFEAHRIAALRGSLSYKKYLVMQYVRNLIAWGDSLFSENTRESISEAIARYLSASDLLGDPPRCLYSAIYEEKYCSLNDLFNSFFQSARTSDENLQENEPLFIYPYNYSAESYFHVPENNEFMALWSDVSDRLYKIRHCLNISGIKQQLSLFSPVINPHQLVNAIATRGNEFIKESLSENSGNERPHYRFVFLVERAKEFSGFVERLGDHFLSALERKDNATLIKLSYEHGQQISDRMEDIRRLSLYQAKTDKDLLEKRRESIQSRIDYYDNLLINGGMMSEEISAEALNLAVAGIDSTIQSIDVASRFAGALPQIGSPFAMTFGGRELFHLTSSGAATLSVVNVMMRYSASLLERTACYKRRQAEWTLQLSLVRKELEELEEQQKIAQLRLQVAEKELDLHQLSMTHQRVLLEYNTMQFTSVELYSWFADQLYDLYNSAFELAFRVVREAQMACQYELGIQFPISNRSVFWSASKKGLLAGSRLTEQLHQMQQAYLDSHSRLYEIEKVVSLREIYCKQYNQTWDDALSELKENGLSFQLLPDLFEDFSKVERDKPRKIKMISVSVPALTGPNQQINLVLTHQRTAEQICISRGIASTGMFNPNFDDARYLPFEGRDLYNSNWTLSLGGDIRNLGEVYDSLTDIQLRICYVIQKDSLLVQNMRS